MADEELKQARSALKAFMSEMNQWEIRFYRAKQNALLENRDTEIVDKEGRSNLIEIISRWAFQDKANEGRLIDLGCTSPPSYDPESDVEEGAELEGGVAVFIIRQTTGLQNQFRFTLKRQGDEWKIKKKELLNFKDKWQRSVL
ncbi:NTF2 fold immunity protein [Burkholderia lata]|uniref:NTF2 fold immunity protein n=1 Tax=Burkholderia lata (strain ATCC 17760 / DSM 23089 / LMG 22485 / NCIMB 9086 / R18194 / 383) TaxID=482957 RepID=UPI0009F47607|nr:NTF2 fold immunity protein [Burkholderia lata]